MPFYEYQCQHCSHHFQKLQKMSDSALKECPSCGKAALVKLVSAPQFQLKGQGWYVTDFKDKPKQTETKGEGETPTIKAVPEKKESSSSKED